MNKVKLYINGNAKNFLGYLSRSSHIIVKGNVGKLLGALSRNSIFEIYGYTDKEIGYGIRKTKIIFYNVPINIVENNLSSYIPSGEIEVYNNGKRFTLVKNGRTFYI